MKSKIKARDLVAGWPRGTSSSKRNLADTQRFMLAWRMELAGWTFASSYVQLVYAELGEKLLYEMSQREMTEDFRRFPHHDPYFLPMRFWRADCGLIVFCDHTDARKLSFSSDPMHDVPMWGCDQCASVFNCDPKELAK